MGWGGTGTGRSIRRGSEVIQLHFFWTQPHGSRLANICVSFVQYWFCFSMICHGCPPTHSQLIRTFERADHPLLLPNQSGLGGTPLILAHPFGSLNFRADVCLFTPNFTSRHLV